MSGAASPDGCERSGCESHAERAHPAGAGAVAGARDGSARGEVLSRIRGALRDVRATAEAPSDVVVPRGYSHERTAEDLIAWFCERAGDYKSTVRRVSAADLPARVASSLAEVAVRRLAVPPELPAGWLAAVSPGAVDVLRDEPPLAIEQLDSADGVLTGCSVAIAETGTVILDASPDQGRRALTLVPDYHLCVVPASAVVGGVPEGLARVDPRRPLTLVSGPSATSDIELDRVEGVHGPRTLELLVVVDA